MFNAAREVATVNRPTIDRNSMPGTFYFDVGGSVELVNKLTAYFKVDNLFDHDPELSPQTNTGIDLNPALYDTLGRVYRVGLQFNLGPIPVRSKLGLYP